MTQISTSPVPKITLLCPIIHLEETRNWILPSQNITWFSPKICLVMTISQLLLSQKWPCSVPYFITLWLNINFSSPKSHLVLFHNSSCYDSISTSPVPKSHPVCPIIHLIMTQYKLLLSRKVTLHCSIIHLVMSLHHLILPHLVRSYFIIV